MNQIAITTFTAELVSEGSYGSTDLGKHESSMTLWEGKNGYYEIEWVIDALDEVEHIGIFTNGARHVIDYDGVCTLPTEAVIFLRTQNFSFEEDALETN